MIKSDYQGEYSGLFKVFNIHTSNKTIAELLIELNIQVTLDFLNQNQTINLKSIANYRESGNYKAYMRLRTHLTDLAHWVYGQKEIPKDLTEVMRQRPHIFELLTPGELASRRYEKKNLDKI